MCSGERCVLDGIHPLPKLYTSGCGGGTKSPDDNVEITKDNFDVPSYSDANDSPTGSEFPQLVSVSSEGTLGNNNSEGPVVSEDGRFVAFTSWADNLVSGDANGIWDTFIHDRQTGETSRVSVNNEGIEGNNGSGFAAVSADGRFVAFYSRADNLVPGDTNDWSDIFIHDRQTGETGRVSVSSEGIEGNSSSSNPAVSGDGQFVMFSSYADNLVPGDTNDEGDIFVHDRQTGETTRVSVSSEGAEGNSDSYNPAVSADGRFVAFESFADNLVSEDTNGLLDLDVFVHDRQTGETSRVGVDRGGVDDSSGPAVSGDGRFVVFDSWADNLVPGAGGRDHIFLTLNPLWTDQ